MECFRFSSSLPEIDVNERLQHVCNIVTNGGKYLTEFLAKFGSKWDHFLLFDLFGEWKTFNMTCVCVMVFPADVSINKGRREGN